MNSGHQNFKLLVEITDLQTIKNRQTIVNTGQENSDYQNISPQILSLEVITCMIFRITRSIQ